VVKHGIPQDKTTGWRCSIVLRRVTKNWVNPDAGYYTVNGDKLLIRNVKDASGAPSVFVRQPSLSSFVATKHYSPTVWPPPVLSPELVRELFLTELGMKEWDWGSEYKTPGFSEYYGQYWWRIAQNRSYLRHIGRHCVTFPKGWVEFQGYMASIESSTTFQGLRNSFETTDEIYSYLKDSMMPEPIVLSAKKRHVRLSDVDIAAASEDDLQMLGREEFGGRTFDALLNMDQDGAILFAEYVRRKVATPMNTPRTSEGSSSSSRPSSAAAAAVPVLPALDVPRLLPAVQPVSKRRVQKSRP